MNFKYSSQELEWGLLECLGPFGAYYNDGAITVFRLIGALPEIIYRFPLEGRARCMQLACELQSGEVAVIITPDFRTYQIVWRSDGGVQTASLKLPQYENIAAYIYQGNVIAAVPDGTKIASTREIVIAYQEVEGVTNTIVFPNGLAAHLSLKPCVINLNRWEKLYSPPSFSSMSCYWQLDSVFSARKGECYQITPAQARLAAQVAKYDVKPVVFESDGLPRLMIVSEGVVVVDDVAFLLPSPFLPECFVTKRGVYFGCFIDDTVPAYGVVSYYSFSTMRVVDILVSCKDGIVELSARKAEKWKSIVASPQKIEMPGEWQVFPDRLRKMLLYKRDKLPLIIRNTEEARTSASLLL